MKKISKTKRPASAESIARLAGNGQNISSYFTNQGKMMPPLATESAAAVIESNSSSGEQNRKLKEENDEIKQAIGHTETQSIRQNV